MHNIPSYLCTLKVLSKKGNKRMHRLYLEKAKLSQIRKSIMVHLKHDKFAELGWESKIFLKNSDENHSRKWTTIPKLQRRIRWEQLGGTTNLIPSLTLASFSSSSMTLDYQQRQQKVRDKDEAKVEEKNMSQKSTIQRKEEISQREKVLSFLWKI